MRNSITVYAFDPDTGELRGPAPAWESPLEPGVFHDPAHTTRTEPPAATPGFAICFRGAWIDVEDHRGETWWTEDGQAVQVDFLGDPADRDLSPDAPEPVQPDIVPEPRCQAAAFNVVVEAGEIAAIEAGAGIPAGFALGGNSYMLFFAAAQRDTAYFPKVFARGAEVLSVDKTEDHLIINLDAEPTSFSVEIWRAE